MEPYDTSKSEEMFARAKAVIPGGIYGHYAGGAKRPAPRYF